MSTPESGLGSLEPLDFSIEMEVDPAPARAAGGMSVAFQCSEDSSSLHGTSPTTPNRHRMRNLCLFDRRNFVGLKDEIQSTMNCMRRYDVRKPIGCAMLLGSDGTPGAPNDLTAVGDDLRTIGQALEDGGWDILYKDSKLCSRTLREQLFALGKEGQLRHLGQQTRDLEEYSVFMLYYSGHGTAEGVVLSDGELFRYKDIVKKIAEVPCLSNKPKIFVFDSCRKEKVEHSTQGTLITAKDHTYSRALADNQFQNQSSHDTYPPPHTVICFSAAEGQPSFQDKVEGSFYTLVLSHSLRQFGSEWSFHEIVTQVNGGTQEIARGHDKNQKPIFKSNLEKLLVLNSE